MTRTRKLAKVVREEIGGRIESARVLTRISREKFCSKYGFSKFTIQSWELGKSVTDEDTIKLFCDALAAEGVYCTSEWILYGKGIPACKRRDFGKNLAPLQQIGNNSQRAFKEEHLILEEIQFFQRIHHQAGRPTLMAYIADKSMQPHYQKGDYVGGNIVSQIEWLCGQICIIEKEPNQFIVRRLMKEGERYLLVATDASYPLLSINQPLCVAEIIWHRHLPKYEGPHEN